MTAETRKSVADKSRWQVNFRNTNLLVTKHGRECCLSTDDMTGYVYGCLVLGNKGEITFSRFVYDMLYETAAVLPFAKRALVLGMGLGLIPQALVNSWTNLNVDVVELSKSVVDVAKEAFCFPEEMRINVILEDVFTWIASAQKRTYDVVYIDIAVGKVMPKKAAGNKFFQEVSRIIKPNGIVTSNVLLHDVKSYSKHLSAYFKSCTIFKSRFVTCIK